MAGRKVLVHQQMEQHVVRSGPLPTPEDFRGYDAVYPGAAKILIDMAQEEAAHRRKMEEKAMARMHREAVLGQIFGLIIGLGGLGATVALAMVGAQHAAVIVGGATLIALVTVFVTGRRKPSR